MRSLGLLIPAAAFATLLAGCATGPSPTQIRLNNLDTRVSKLERLVSNGSLVQLAQQQDSLQAQVRDLRGQLDDLQRSNRQLRKQQHDLYAALAKRISALGRAQAPAGTATAGSQPPTASGAASSGGAPSGMLPGVTPAEQSAYDHAFNALKAGKYSVAISGFQGFLHSHPGSPLAPNCQYWLGETHFVNQDYKEAEQAFRTLLRRWPDSGKVKDAMLDLGNVLLVQGEERKGREMLRQVVKRFPGTEAAARAAKRLRK